MINVNRPDLGAALSSLVAGVAASSLSALLAAIAGVPPWLVAAIIFPAFLVGSLVGGRVLRAGAPLDHIRQMLPYALITAIITAGLAVQGVHAAAAAGLTLVPIGLAWFAGASTPPAPPAAKVDVTNHASSGGARLLRWLPWIAFGGSMAALEYAWGSRFYNSATHVGHDFALSGIGLLEAKYWLDANGLLRGLVDPPWFTPAWCAGAAFFADPQSAFYSTLTLLTLLVDPFRAAHLNMLLYAVIGFWGSFAVARRVFGWSTAAATVFAVLGTANAFLPMRSAVGELGYQPLYLWTVLALALCWRVVGTSWRSHMWPIIAVAMILTIWLHAAFAGMMIPVVMGTLALCLVAVIAGRAALWPIVWRMTGGGLLAIVLNLSKLYESASLMRQFPRDFYALPGFPQLADAVVSVGFALLQPSQWTAEFGLRKLADVRFTALPHEWALQFGLGSVAMVVVCVLALLLYRGQSAAGAQPERPNWPKLNVSIAIAIAALVVIATIPVLLLWSNPGLRELFKQIPILNSAAWPMRWIVVYVPLAQWLLVIPCVLIARKMRPNHATQLALVSSALVWLGPILEPVGYYLDPNLQGYDPRPVRVAHANSLSAPPVAIREVVVPDASALPLNRNDMMLYGKSQGLCYNPLYGYRLEAFPQIGRLFEGPVLDRDVNGMSVIFNPACLVHPTENKCVPGDGFRLDDPLQRLAAQQFVARKPFDWQRPAVGKAWATLSQGVFWVLFALIGLKFSTLAVRAGVRMRTASRRAAS